MFNDYSLEIRKIFKDAEREMLELHHPYVGTEHLFLSLLKNDKRSIKLFNKYRITYELFKNELVNVIGKARKKSEYVLWTPLLKKVVNEAEKQSKKRNNELQPIDLLVSLMEEDGIAIRILLEMRIDMEKVLNELKRLYNTEELELYKIGKDLQKNVSMNEKVFGREKEIELVMETLIKKNKNNPLLIGEAGVGKTAIVEELARMINIGNVPPMLKNKKIVMLEMGSLVAGTKYRGEFEEKLQRIISEIEDNENIILFIDEIHTLVNAGGAEGAVNASDILKPYMARNNIKIIGATTINEYNNTILKDKALNRRFELIMVNEPSLDETIHILSKIKSIYENHYNIKISLSNIKYLVNMVDKYIKNQYNPDKSIDILDGLCAKKKLGSFDNKVLDNISSIKEEKKQMVRNNNYSRAIELCDIESNLLSKYDEIVNKKVLINKKDIKEYIMYRCNIDSLNNKIKTLDNYLKKNTINNNEAINKMVSIIKTWKLNKPLGFLLNGSSKEDRIEMIKKISNYLKIPLLKLNMNDYSNDTSINRLIGVTTGYVGYNEMAILDRIKMQPKTIILIENIEKASSNIHNLFLQILDDGVISNAKGELIDFTNTYIFIVDNIKEYKSIGFINNRIKDNNDLDILKKVNVIDFNNKKVHV